MCGFVKFIVVEDKFLGVQHYNTSFHVMGLSLQTLTTDFESNLYNP